MATTKTAAAPCAIPLCVPELAGNEWKYVKECLDTGWVSSVGSFVPRFEALLAARTGRRFAVATTSGTAALHVALLVAGVRPDDEVLVSSLTFIAPANAIRYVGAWPVFVDADPVYWQMDPDLVRNFLRNDCRSKAGVLFNRTTGRRVSCIIPVHILGHPVDMRPLQELACEFNLRIVEDATESLGAQYRGKAVGNLGESACFSFNGNKLITTGGGGMLVTDNPGWAETARMLTTQHKDDPIEYVHQRIGYNYRMTNVQAALGVAQIERMDDLLAAKRRIATAYRAALESLPGVGVMREAPWARSAFWMYTAMFDEHRFGMSARALLRELESRGIQTRPLWQPIHCSPAHAGSLSLGGRVAEECYASALNLPCSAGLSVEQQVGVIRAIREIQQPASRRVV